MQNKLPVVLSLILLLSISAFAYKNPETLAKHAVYADQTQAEIAITLLRELNQKGLDAMFEVHKSEIDAYRKTGNKTAEWQKISEVIDSVAMQKDAYASKLFWHTDIEKAKAQAQKENKPILTLRLLGNLNEEYSCANSRFFRSILYSNQSISNKLRENYILHWKSVRPAPKVTIDFGDGRKIERTLTGNSIHYVLDKNGRVVDAMPGLNSPHKFLNFLSSGVTYSQLSTNKGVAGVLVVGSDENMDALQRVRAMEYGNLSRKINNTGNRLKLKFDTKKESKRNFEKMPPAMTAATMAITKSAVEVNILKDITPDITKFGGEQIDFEQWKKIAHSTGSEAKLDEQSISFIKNQTASNNLSDKQFNSLIEKLEQYVSVDTARNDFLLRLTLLVWLNKGLDNDLDKLNEKVYSELFLTPSNDKWLGLYAPELYTALDGNGITK